MAVTKLNFYEISLIILKIVTVEGNIRADKNM